MGRIRCARHFFSNFTALLTLPTEPFPLSQTGVFGTHYPFGLRFDATGWFEGKQAGRIRCARHFFSIFTTLLTLPTELFPLGQTGVFGTPSACVLTRRGWFRPPPTFPCIETQDGGLPTYHPPFSSRFGTADYLRRGVCLPTTTPSARVSARRVCLD